MTTTRALCGVLDAALQGSGAERQAARLVRAGYLPRSGDEDDAASTPAARRQRRHRARRKQGRFVVPVEVTCEMIAALVDQGDVDEAMVLAQRLADIPQMTAKSVEIVLPFPRQGNCIPSAAIG